MFMNRVLSYVRTVDFFKEYPIVNQHLLPLPGTIVL